MLRGVSVTQINALLPPSRPTSLWCSPNSMAIGGPLLDCSSFKQTNLQIVSSPCSASSNPRLSLSPRVARIRAATPMVSCTFHRTCYFFTVNDPGLHRVRCKASPSVVPESLYFSYCDHSSTSFPEPVLFCLPWHMLLFLLRTLLLSLPFSLGTIFCT
ncbi:hypothetical protein EI94DRAFT_607731 [Lactarius quietus]|nr:hypothetical protein EI94DRAFT_607731 [Lactarius quietus]